MREQKVDAKPPLIRLFAGVFASQKARDALRAFLFPKVVNDAIIFY